MSTRGIANSVLTGYTDWLGQQYAPVTLARAMLFLVWPVFSGVGDQLRGRIRYVLPYVLIVELDSIPYRFLYGFFRDLEKRRGGYCL